VLYCIKTQGRATSKRLICAGAKAKAQLYKFIQTKFTSNNLLPLSDLLKIIALYYGIRRK